MDFQNIIQYFRECYRNDNKSLSVTNIFNKEVEYLQLIEEKEEFLTQHLPYIPIEEDYGITLYETLKVYEKEKQLYYFSFLMLGKTNDNTGVRKVAAPLFLLPAEVIFKDGLPYIVPDLSSIQVNASVLRPLFKDTNSDSDFNNVIVDQFSHITNFNNLGYRLDEHFEDLDTTRLIDYPNLYNEKKIKRFLSPGQLKQTDEFKIVPASGIGIFKKSSESLGILNELQEVSESVSPSAPLADLFHAERKTTNGHKLPGRLPTLLSRAQKAALTSAINSNLSLIIGPPGTGKSYTIAAMAIEQLTENKPVLIVSRTDKAVDVIADKIEEELDLPGLIVRGGKRQYMKDLKQRLNDMVHGIGIDSSIKPLDIKKSNHRILLLEKEIKALQEEFVVKTNKEMRTGKYLADHFHSTSLLHRIKKYFLKLKHEKSDPMWRLMEQITTKQDQLNHEVRQLVKISYNYNQTQLLTHDRSQFNLLNKALRARTGAKQDEYFGKIDYSILLRTFPIWLVNMKDLYKVLPMTKELFELAIIDEATQCDIAACLPVLHRAKKAVVTGDPKQRRHISFLSRSVQNHLKDKFKLDQLDHLSDEVFNYRENSIIDLVSDRIQDQKQVVFLNEHYRSTPAIIRFSNTHFYQNAISVMTEKPELPYNHGLHLVRCQGTRDEKGINHVEADYVITQIKQVFDREKTLNASECRSIGILSPFRNQVEHLRELIRSELTLDIIDRHKILSGTAYEFQGEERDVMFLSLSLDDNSHSMAFYHLNKPDVFNVSITRARTRQEVLYSFNETQLKTNSLVRQYIESISSNGKLSNQNPTSKDLFLQEVKSALQQSGLKTWEAFEVAGLEIDLVAGKEKQIVGIDLIGYPGQFEDAFNTERYKILARAGFKMMPLAYSRWLFNREACLAMIIRECAGKSSNSFKNNR